MIKEVLLGVVFAVPALAITRRLPHFKIDDMLGNLSYGIFLNHFLIIWALRHFGYEVGWAYLLILIFFLSHTRDDFFLPDRKAHNLLEEIVARAQRPKSRRRPEPNHKRC
jgi:hypothetical protein